LTTSILGGQGDPVLHLIVGANGSGKSTFFDRELGPLLRLPFVNADLIAKERWPEEAEQRSYEAAALASALRSSYIEKRWSFVAETVFSHPSKLDLITDARANGFLVTLHVLLIPEELSVVRVGLRVKHGGHSVPEEKIRGRYARLWTNVASAIEMVDEAVVYDNTNDVAPFRVVARYRSGHLVTSTTWPTWTPGPLRTVGLI
jgi:predicted ABC-type ATPase